MDWQNWCRLCGNYEKLTKISENGADVAKKLDVSNFSQFSSFKVINLRLILDWN